ncbi:MAG: hypothetical protein H7061_04880 [Bdellovibrionaceae bacterium]|nr:hypothetical protein [Bdellovibrio sp.]
MLFFLLVINLVFSQTQSIEQKADQFFSWLNENESTFTNCKIEKKGDQIILCDQTKVSYKELSQLFKKNTSQIITDLKKRKLEVEVVCDNKSSGAQKTELPCVNEVSNPSFKKVSSLHGLYVPEENKIYIKSSASVGVIIHEYLHYLQTQNLDKVNGHIYKGEKNELKKQIEKALDQLMTQIKQLEKENKKLQLKTPLQRFIKLNDYLIAFGKWQDLIDERSLFLLFTEYQKDFAISKEDMALVQKNISFICSRKDLKGKLSKKECS